MKALLQLFVYISLFFAYSQTHAASYYVDPDGDNSDSGSTSSPWETIQYGVDQLSPGDTLYVRNGRYHESVRIRVSGTISNRITVTAAPGESPIIDGTGVDGGINHSGSEVLGGIVIIDENYITVSGFRIRDFDGSDGNFPSGIWVRGNSKDITISNNEIYEIQSEEGEGAHGIACYGTDTDPMEGLIVEGNIIYDCELQWSEALVLNGNVRGFLVAYNDVHDVDNIAYDFIGYEGECDDCESDTADADDVDRARQGLVIGNIARNVDTTNNSRYNQPTAGGFYVDGGRDIIIEGNISAYANYGIELASEHAGLTTENIVVRNNIVYHCDISGITTGGYTGGNDSNSGNPNGKGLAVNCFILNNTLYKNTRNSWSDVELMLQNRNRNNVYMNNIIVADGENNDALTIGYTGDGNSGNVFDYNLHYSTDDNGNEEDIDTDEFGPSSIVADPRLADAENQIFSILSDSAAINSGINLAEVGDCDFAGMQRQGVGAIDIGAYEFGAASCNANAFIAITSPSNGEVFEVGSDVEIEVDAFDDDGVASVAFYQGATLLGVDLTFPYSYSWTSVPAGNYELSAVMTDSTGDEISAATSISVEEATSYAAWDDFESSGFSGGYGWAGDWSLVESTHAIALHEFDGNLSVRLRNESSITRTLSEGLVNAQIDFKWDVDSLESGESVALEVYNGAWNTVWTKDDDDEGSDSGTLADNLAEASVDVSSWGTITQIRISIANASSGGDRLFVDDIGVIGDVAPPPVDVAADDFESDDFSGGFGWAGDWVLDAGEQPIVIREHESNHAVRLRDESSITRELSTPASGVSIDFTWDVDSLESGESVALEVYNGSWNTVWTKDDDDEGSDSGTLPDNLTPATVNLTSWGAITQIRFRIVDANSTGDRFFVDDVLIY